MTAPLRVTCPTAGDIPPAYQLRAWATDDRHVVLRLPNGSLAEPTHTKETIVARLAAALPDFRVSDGGGDHLHELVTVARRPE
jgi:hypothetical protein